MRTHSDDCWITVLDPGAGAPVDPDQDPGARGILAGSAEVAAMIAVQEAQGLGDGPHRVAVCHPGPPPKLIHVFVVTPVPPKSVDSQRRRSYLHV